MKPEKLKHFIGKLREEKDRLIKQIGRIEQTGLASALGESLSELSTYDNHPADIGDELFERSKDLALRDNAHVMLESVKVALDRTKTGEYGKCMRCGKDIEEARLEVIPWASECIHCKKQAELQDVTPRPLEEEVLAPPFHRTFLDTADFDNVGFDGEDSWQAVARYGSSDTPQDIPGADDYKALWANSHNEHQGIVDIADFIPNDTDGAIDQGEMSYEEFLAREEQEEDQPDGEESPHH